MSDVKQNKEHVSICIAGSVDSGKSTCTGRLIYDLGGISEREMAKLAAEADAIGKSSFKFAFFMDRQKEEQAKGVTISVTTKEFFTESKHYTILDCPGHDLYIKNMITGSSQADVALLMVPADGNFTTSISKGDHKKGVHMGQSRHHALLLNLLGVKQLIVGINKMDCDMAKFGKERYDEVLGEAKAMLMKVGWKKDFVQNCVPFLPISGWTGENLLKKSEIMPWWSGVDVKNLKGETVHVNCLMDALDKLVQIPERKPDSPMRLPISGIYSIKGVGNVLTGRVEQGQVKPGTEVVFLPTHTAFNPCTGKVFTVEMHHKPVPEANPGDNVGLNIKGLDKNNMPRVGDVMVLKSDTSIRRCKSFTAQVQVLNHPGELKPGYCPIAFVRTGRSAVRMSKIDWKVGKETGGTKMENPPHLKANEMAQVVFEPMQPFVVDSFKNCEGLGRVAIMEGNGVVMLGKATKVEFAVEEAKK